MDKITITLDTTKITKSKITERKYKNKEGQEVTAKEYKLDIVPLKEKRLLKAGDGWKMMKTHFVAETLTKEERSAGAPTVYVGEGITFDKGNDESGIPF